MRYLTFIILFFVSVSIKAQSWLPDECTAQQPPVALDSAFILLSDSRTGINQCRGQWQPLLNYGLIRREKVALTYADFVGSGIANLHNEGYIVASTNNIIIHSVAVVVNTNFEGGTITAVALDIGIDGSEELYAANVSVSGLETPVGTIHTNTALIILNEPTHILATLDISDGSEGDLTGGSVTLYFYYSILE